MKNLLLLILATFTFQMLVANDTLVNPQMQIKMMAQAFCDENMDELNRLTSEIEIIMIEMNDDEIAQFEDSLKTVFMRELEICLPKSFEPDLVEYIQNTAREKARAYFKDDDSTLQLIEQQIDSII
jgi:hypothetical protein